MQKKILLFVILSALLVLGSSGTLYAWSYTDWVDYLGQLRVRDDVPSSWKSKINTFFQHESEFAAQLSGYKNFYMNMSFGGAEIYATNNTLNNCSVNKTQGYAPLQFTSVRWEDFYFTIDHVAHSYTTMSSLNAFPALVEVPESIEEQFQSWMWFQNKFDLGFTFEPVGVTEVNYNGYQGLNAKKVNSNLLTLGTLTKPSEKYKYYRFLLFDPNGSQVGWLDYNTDNDYYSSNNIDAFLDPLTIYVERRLIYLKQVYTLTIYASDEVINNDNTNIDDSRVLTYIFLPENATISGGTITDAGSGDNYTNQDSTNDIINNINNSTNDINNTLTDTSEANDTINNFFSGDADSFANSIGYSPIENPFVAIIRNTLTSLVNVFLGNGNVTLQISWAGENITLNSDDFTLPSGPIKTFIALICNGFLLWAIVKYGFVLYQWINSGRLQNMVNEVNGHWYKMLF